MRKVYISDIDKNLEELDEVIKKFDIVKDIEESNDVLVVPGGMGSFSDIFDAYKLKKKVYLYNKDMYYKDLINNLYKGHLEGYIDGAPGDYMHIESELSKIIEDMEEKEDGKTNNGQTR
jgi:predicted Rossmann-fold nucleotide-binding protein